MMIKYERSRLQKYKKLLRNFIFLALLIQIYSFFNLFGTIKLRSRMKFYFPQLFFYGNVSNFYPYSFNLQRIMMMDYEFEVNSKSSLEISEKIIKSFLSFDMELFDVF